MMKLEEREYGFNYDSFCIKEQKLYLRTFHKFLDRLTGIFLLNYAEENKKKSTDYYEKFFQNWLEYLETNLPPNLKRHRLILKNMILGHKANDPLMREDILLTRNDILRDFLRDENFKFKTESFKFPHYTDIKRKFHETRNFRIGELNPADLIYQCLHYDLFKIIDPTVGCRGKRCLSDKKRFIQKRKFELEMRHYYIKIIESLLTIAYETFDPDYTRRGVRGRKKKNASILTYPSIYELLPQKSKSYKEFLLNFKKFFKENHFLSGNLILRKQTSDGQSEFLDSKHFLEPYIPFAGYRYQEISSKTDVHKMFRIRERDDITNFLSKTGLKKSLNIGNEDVVGIDFLYCLTIARYRLEYKIRKMDSIFDFN